MSEEEVKALLAELEQLKADKAAALERIAELEEAASAEAADAPPAVDPAEAEAEAAKEEAMSALLAEVKELREKVQAAEAEKFAARKTAAIEELLANHRIKPAERETVERAYDAEMANPDAAFKPFTEVYASRPSNSAVPSPKGHGGVESEVSGAHKAVEAYMAANKLTNYADAAARLGAEKPEIFYKAKA